VSAKAISWARGSGMRGAAQAVLLALASHHNPKTGECRPSLDGLSRDSGLTRPTVCKALRELQAADLVAWTKGADARGQRATNLYILAMDNPSPRVKPLNSGEGKPRVKHRDVGESVPELSCLTRNKNKGREQGETDVESHGALSGNCFEDERGKVEPRRPYNHPDRVAIRRERAAKEQWLRAFFGLADEYDAAQERGEVAGHGGGRHFKVDIGNVEPTAADLGLRRDEIDEAAWTQALADLWQDFEAQDNPWDERAWA
jgi:hypothetical protein